MRAMVNVFEKDANMLKKYMKAFLGSCQKIVNAQVIKKLLFYYSRSSKFFFFFIDNDGQCVTRALLLLKII